jgi:hypothetical protein
MRNLTEDVMDVRVLLDSWRNSEESMKQRLATWILDTQVRLMWAKIGLEDELQNLAQQAGENNADLNKDVVRSLVERSRSVENFFNQRVELSADLMQLVHLVEAIDEDLAAKLDVAMKANW